MPLEQPTSDQQLTGSTFTGEPTVVGGVYYTSGAAYVQSLQTDASGSLFVRQAQDLPTTSSLRVGVVNVVGNGNNTMISGSLGQTIRVWKMFLVFSAGGSVFFSDGASNPLSGPLNMFSGGAIVLDLDQTNPWFMTTKNNDFMINLSGGAAAGGSIYYTQS